MNNELQKFARTTLKSNLIKCTDSQRDIFARMYGRFGTNDNINTVVDGIPADKLDWAMQQIVNTLVKNERD